MKKKKLERRLLELQYHVQQVERGLMDVSGFYPREWSTDAMFVPGHIITADKLASSG